LIHIENENQKRDVRRSHPDIFNNDEQKRINFLPTSVTEEILVQNTLIAYYDQQKNELIERQK